MVIFHSYGAVSSWFLLDHWSAMLQGSGQTTEAGNLGRAEFLGSVERSFYTKNWDLNAVTVL